MANSGLLGEKKPEALGRNGGILPQPGQQPETPEEPKPVSQNLIRAISQNLLRTGFDILGGGFASEFSNPQLQQSFSQMGMDISNVLQTRWWQKEAENFDSQYFDSYKQAMLGLQDSVGVRANAIDSGVVINPDGSTLQIDPTSEEAVREREKIIRDYTMGISRLDVELFDNAKKYASNPIINNMVQGIVTQRAQAIAQMTQPSGLTQGELTRAQIYATRREGETAGLRARAAGAPKRAESPEELRARVGDQGILGYLTGTADGQTFMQDYADRETARYTKEVTDQLRLDRSLEPDESAIKDVVIADRDKILKRAAVKYVRDVYGEGLYTKLRGDPRFKTYFDVATPTTPAPTPEYRERLATPERQAVVESYQQKAMEEMVTAARKEKFDNVKSLIDYIINIWLEPIMDSQIANIPETEQLKKDIRSKVPKFLKDNWNKNPVLREFYSSESAKKKAESITLSR